MNHSPTPGWEDLRITAFAPRTSAPSQANFSTTPAGYEIQSWEFPNNGTERGLNGVTQMPHAWYGLATPIYLHLHMSTTGVVAAGTDVGFFVSLMSQKIGDPIASAFIAQYWVHKVVPVGGYAAKTHIITDEIAIPATNFGLSSMLMLYVFRQKGTAINTANAGVVTENVNDVLWLHEVDFHVQRYDFGTNNPSSP